MQQCRLLKIPSPQVLQRYRLGQAPRLSATQQERAALIANIQYSLTAEPGPKDRAWAWVHAPSHARRRSTATARCTSCWKTACRPCAKWPGFWFAKASLANGPIAILAG